MALLDCEIEIRIKFELETVPGMQRISDAISIDKELLPGATFSIIKIEAAHKWEEDEK